MKTNHYFALVIGSSFTGSILAWILQSQGRNVCVVDRQEHPRFAIGESSTPTADFLIAHLAERWNLPALAPLACWGSWKLNYPNIRCGKKRGFSYYAHCPDQPFTDDPEHSRSLLVAASSEDRFSDTQWLRSDVDQFLFTQASRAGVASHEESSIASAQWCDQSNHWIVTLQDIHGQQTQLTATWLLDASGGGSAITKWVGQHDDSQWMRTKTGALYGHFSGVKGFSATSQIPGNLSDDPFCGDDAAQHHVVDDGWYWMLRFDDGTTSVGLVRPTTEWPTLVHDTDFRKVFWQDYLECFPSVRDLMADSHLVAPHDGLRFHARLSRCANVAAGKNWAALPTTVGFIDPLHSTGIAHGLSGVARLSEILLGDEQKIPERLMEYSQDVRNEIEWMDTLVAGCYQGLPSFELFRSYAAFYFAAAIGFEKQMAADPAHWPSGYMLAKDLKLRDAAETIFQKMSLVAAGIQDEESIVESMRQSLDPWNDVGLLDPQLRNRLAHTRAPKYASAAFRSVASTSQQQ
jgi:tetracycline 7-halogenase / FADH2 O2-dependent halogenase